MGRGPGEPLLETIATLAGPATIRMTCGRMDERHVKMRINYFLEISDNSKFTNGWKNSDRTYSLQLIAQQNIFDDIFFYLS